MCTVAGSIGHS
jgi:hypothetical protein